MILIASQRPVDAKIFRPIAATVQRFARSARVVIRRTVKRSCHQILNAFLNAFGFKAAKPLTPMLNSKSARAVSSMVEHFVYTEGVGSSSLSPPISFLERHSKDAALVFWVGEFGDHLYIFYSGRLKAQLASGAFKSLITRRQKSFGN